MKSLLQPFVAIFIICTMGSPGTLNAAATVLPETGIRPPDWSYMKLKTLLSLNASEFYQLTGKKLTMKEKLAFALLRGKMKKELKRNPEMTVREFLDSINTINKAGWIILGVVILALLFLIIIFKQLPD